MELRHLRYFVMSAEELNISRAASRLRVSQPAVSRQIKDLEDELGFVLFQRDPSGLRLSAAGATFLPHARDILRRTREAVENLQSLHGAAKIQLAVGYIAPALTGILTSALRKFAHLRPNVSVELIELNPAEQTSGLRQKKIDLALLGTPCPDVGVEFAIKNLSSTPLSAVVPDHHLLALRKKVRMEELAGEKFIGFCDKTYPDRNHLIRVACEQAGFTPQIEQLAHNLTSALALVASGKGITLMPEEPGHLPHPHAVFITLQPPAPAVISAAAWRRDDGRAELKDLIECCESSPSVAPRKKPLREPELIA